MAPDGLKIVLKNESYTTILYDSGNRTINDSYDYGITTSSKNKDDNVPFKKKEDPKRQPWKERDFVTGRKKKY